jgi:leader peptidase (prepilin peptidase)/N-methyltransferase
VSIIYGALGLVIGGFLNLAADHLPRDRSPFILPACAKCGTSWSWGEREAWARLLGLTWRCPQCSASCEIRRPALALGTAVAFGFFWMRYGFSAKLFLISLYSCALFLIFVIDLEHRLILRVVVYPAILLALVGSHFYPGLGLRRAVVGGAVAFLFFYLVAVLGRLVFRRTAMGGGDANLAALVGLMTGFPDVIVALLVTVCLGGLVSLALVVGGMKGLQSYIPYGIFLAAGGLIVLVFGAEIIGWYFGLF